MVTVCGCTTGPVLIITENMVGLYELENVMLVESIAAVLQMFHCLHVYSMSTCSSFRCTYNCYLFIYACRLAVESRANHNSHCYEMRNLAHNVMSRMLLLTVAVGHGKYILCMRK